MLLHIYRWNIVNKAQSNAISLCYIVIPHSVAWVPQGNCGQRIQILNVIIMWYLKEEIPRYEVHHEWNLKVLRSLKVAQWIYK